MYSRVSVEIQITAQAYKSYKQHKLKATDPVLLGNTKAPSCKYCFFYC